MTGLYDDDDDDDDGVPSTGIIEIIGLIYFH